MDARGVPVGANDGHEQQYAGFRGEVMAWHPINSLTGAKIYDDTGPADTDLYALDCTLDIDTDPTGVPDNRATVVFLRCIQKHAGAEDFYFLGPNADRYFAYGNVAVILEEDDYTYVRCLTNASGEVPLFWTDPCGEIEVWVMGYLDVEGLYNDKQSDTINADANWNAEDDASETKPDALCFYNILLHNTWGLPLDINAGLYDFNTDEGDYCVKGSSYRIGCSDVNFGNNGSEYTCGPVSACSDTDGDIARQYYEDHDVSEGTTCDCEVYMQALAQDRYKKYETEVFNTTLNAADTWETLDLSSTIGAKSSYVRLRIKTSGPVYFKVQPYGESSSPDHSDSCYGCTGIYVGSNYVGSIEVPTDEDGKIQIACSSDSVTVTIDVLCAFDEIPVFDGGYHTAETIKVFGPDNPPTAFTDLDLSSVVGEQAVFVFLKVTQTSGAMDTYATFRPNGATEDWYDNQAGQHGSTEFRVNQLNLPCSGLLGCMTDSSGVVEWRTNSVVPTFEVYVVGWLDVELDISSVFYGAMPAAWTERDKVGIWGENPTFAILKTVATGGTVTNTTALRNADETDDLLSVTTGGPNQCGQWDANTYGYQLTTTDSDGKFDIIAQAVVPEVDWHVEAYCSAVVEPTSSVVFAAAAPPTSWTDLDLTEDDPGGNPTGLTGCCLVILKIHHAAGGDNRGVEVRPNGDSGSYVTGKSAGPKGCADCYLAADEYTYLITETDSDGVIEWICNDSDVNFDINLVGWIENEVVEPTVTTQAATAVLVTSATGNGNITDDGGGDITQHGVCWKLGSDPVDIAGADGYTEEGAGAEGAFTSTITPLIEVTTYYYRAYATNSEGTTYGAAQSFTTKLRPRII